MTSIKSPFSATVAITRAQNYELNEMRNGIAGALDLIGGLKSIVKRRDKVFIKINHLPPPSPPERGIVTHPIFTEAVITLLKDLGAEITVGDDIELDDGGFGPSGYTEMCKRNGVRLVSLREGGFTARKINGIILKEVYFARTALEADVFINLPKLKTHSLCTYTGAVKNLYGCIPVGLRRQYHGEYLPIEEFCQMCADIYSAAPPNLNILDGIMAMEGEGPGNGKVRKMGIILAARDGVALDAVANKIIGLEPANVLTTRYAGECGLGISDLSKIEVKGETIESVSVKDFKLPATVAKFVTGRTPRGLAKFAITQITPRPYVDKKTCQACRECVKVCPAGAATMNDKNAEINHAKCISCMCCHEVCRYDAIVPRRPWLGRILFAPATAVRKLMRK